MKISREIYNWYHKKRKIVGIYPKSTYLLFIEHGYQGKEYLVLSLNGTEVYQVSKPESGLVKDFFYVEVV